MHREREGESESFIKKGLNLQTMCMCCVGLRILRRIRGINTGSWVLNGCGLRRSGPKLLFLQTASLKRFRARAASELRIENAKYKTDFPEAALPWGYLTLHTQEWQSRPCVDTPTPPDAHTDPTTSYAGQERQTISEVRLEPHRSLHTESTGKPTPEIARN